MQIRELLEEEDYEDLMTEGGWRGRSRLRRRFAKRPVLRRTQPVARPAPKPLRRRIPAPPRCAPCVCPAPRPPAPVPKPARPTQPVAPPRNLAPVPPVAQRQPPPFKVWPNPKAPSQPPSNPQRLRPGEDEGRA